MATYKDIELANQNIRTTTIERKDKRTGEITSKEYAEVNQRIKAFRMVYPEGFISTELLSNENGVCIFKARCGYYVNGDPDKMILLGTGTAYEQEGSTFINQTSYIENGETSAVGRALGMAGFGIDTSVASAEEMRNAIANQVEKPTEKAAERKASEKQIALLARAYTGESLDKLLALIGVGALDELPMRKASELISKLKERSNANA